MEMLKVTAHVDAEGFLEVRVATHLPPGDYEAVIVVHPGRPKATSRVEDLPVHDTPWDDSVSLRRVDLYGSHGR